MIVVSLIILFIFIHPFITLICSSVLSKKYKEDYEYCLSGGLYVGFLMIGAAIMGITSFIGGGANASNVNMSGSLGGMIFGMVITTIIDVVIVRKDFEKQYDTKHEPINKHLKNTMGEKYYQKEYEINKMTEREKLDLLKKEYYASMPSDSAEAKKKEEDFYLEYRRMCRAMLTIMFDNYEKALREQFEQKQKLEDEIELNRLLRR